MSSLKLGDRYWKLDLISKLIYIKNLPIFSLQELAHISVFTKESDFNQRIYYSSLTHLSSEKVWVICYTAKLLQ